MTVFQYPKSKHRRALKPRQFKRYGSYKRYLQTEFSRVCVYCRQPDSSVPNLVFGVDHYRPKGIKRFASLVCSYDNLYYCCGNCNSRKNNYWPIDESAGPFVVNPCDHEMAKHLVFNATTGEVDWKSPDGEKTVRLLQLNDSATVKYRRQTLVQISSATKTIAEVEQLNRELVKMFKTGKIDQATFAQEFSAGNSEIELLRDSFQAMMGTTPLPPLQRQRQGVRLLP